MSASDNYSFANTLWNYDLQTDTVDYKFYNTFSRINVETVLYYNTEYDSYVAWLSGPTASSYVDEQEPHLTSSLLASFQSRVANYTPWSMHVAFEYNNVPVTNQEVAFCIEENVINNGISCAGASNGSSTIQMTETFTYWLPSSHGSSLTGTYDLT